MRQFHKDGFRNMRPLVVAAVVVAAMATSGCHWFGKRGNPYSQSAQTRPLEVPPDLDKPNTEGAMGTPDAKEWEGKPDKLPLLER